MTKVTVTKCDICGALTENAYIIEMRADPGVTVLNTITAGDEKDHWDVCPDCRKTLLEFFMSRNKPVSDVPVIPVIQGVTNTESRITTAGPVGPGPHITV